MEAIAITATSQPDVIGTQFERGRHLVLWGNSNQEGFDPLLRRQATCEQILLRSMVLSDTALFLFPSERVSGLFASNQR